ncbi:hypothetical protein [Archangium sp.]|jgi:hypothetical protein|uniref:hypothetical protein n=1 Tax=Archangium sp. TaxID=1872627 RepID=UPI002EDA64F3
MNLRSRIVPPLAAALLLGTALALRFFGPAPEAKPQAPERRSMPAIAAVVAMPPPVPVSPAAAPARPEPVKAEARVELAEGRATVVPIGPGDVVPEPEVENPPPQENDPIEPEKPQTAAWKHGKMVRISELLGRDVERLEQERLSAEKRGDSAEARRLEVQLSRHKARLGTLREEMAALAEAARHEPAE